jgi:hypothetical protein
MLLHSTGFSLPPAPPGTSSAWDSHIPTLRGYLPLGLHQATALQACQITIPPGSYSGCHRRAPNLPNRHRQTGQDAKGVTSDQLILKFYCSRTGDFFPLLSDLLFDHPSSLPFFHFFLSSFFLFFFYLSFSFSFFPLSFLILSELIL